MVERNIWQRFVGKDLTDAMSFCGCDSKYTDGNASDYEKLGELLRVAQKMRGHKAVEAFLGNVNSAYGVSLDFDELIPENAHAIWSMSYEENPLKLKKTDNKNVEKYNLLTNAICIESLAKDRLDYDGFIKTVCSKVSGAPTAVFAAFKEKSFQPPNPYLARQHFDNCEIIKNDILICQIICEIILKDLCRKTEFYLDFDGNMDYAYKFISYMHKHNMYAHIFLRVDPSCNIEDMINVCRLSSSKSLILPYICVTKNKIDEKHKNYLNDLARSYPLGMIRMIENK
jgi:hypothetical protein